MNDNPFFDGDTDRTKALKDKMQFQKELTLTTHVSKEGLQQVEFDRTNTYFGDKTITDENFVLKKQEILDDLNRLSKTPVQEFTFRKKWEELQDIPNVIIEKAAHAKDSIWTPTDIDNEELTIQEISALRPKVLVANNPDEDKWWTTLRIFCSSAEFNQAPGRFIKFLMVDEVTGKVLGVVSIASDVIAITARDKYIGWTLEDKLTHKMLKHSAIGTTIVPTQPLGSNFLGGKLVAALVTSGVVRREWENQTKGESISCKLVGMTTTSLYGRPSMYNSLKWWTDVGDSKGKIPIQPSQEYYALWHEYVKRTNPDKYLKMMTQKEGISGPVTGAKMRILSMIFDVIGVKQSDYVHGFERGVYYSCFYENTKDFLCRKITEDQLVLKPLFKNDVQAIMDWWRPKAIERYKKLKSENRLNKGKLFYGDMLLPKNGQSNGIISYEEAKAKYLGAVGR